MTAISALALLGGCQRPLDDPRPDGGNIILGVSGLKPAPAQAVDQTSTRAAVDAWDTTQVSVAYVFAPATIYDRSLTVSVMDNVNGQHVNTGMAYPADNSPVSFIGYYPVAAPSALGTVTYDISKGDVDVMMSNSVSGTLDAPITDKLDFSHRLTRITFKLNCATGQTYPEPIFGIRADPSTSTALLTAVMLDFQTETVNFRLPGSVFCGNVSGYVVPQSWDFPVVMDMMVQPDVPLDFSVVSLTAVRNINITSDPDGLWNTLTTVGGTEGMRYTVQLYFSGIGILAQDISAVPWTSGNQNLGNNSGNPWL